MKPKHPLATTLIYGAPFAAVLFINAVYVNSYNLRSEALAYHAGIHRPEMSTIAPEAITAVLVFIILIRIEYHNQWMRNHASQAPSKDPQTQRRPDSPDAGGDVSSRDKPEQEANP
jgi:hypothetical protein